MRALSEQSGVAWRMRRMLRASGKSYAPDLETHIALHQLSTRNILISNCWLWSRPSFNWQENLDDKTIASFQQQLSDIGYKFQFITLAGIHSMWFNMFDLANAYAQGEGMKHYVEKVQQPGNATTKRWGIPRIFTSRKWVQVTSIK